MANYPQGNSMYGSTDWVITDRRPSHLGFSPPTINQSPSSLGFETQMPSNRSHSPSYMVYTPSFISFKVTNLFRVLRFSMNRTEIREKSILKYIKQTTQVKAKSLFLREIGGTIIRLDNDLMLQYHIEQMESRQRREGIPSEMELLIGDKYGTIIVPPTQGWMNI